MSASTAGTINPKARRFTICAALLALFLGALDTLVMSAAMPTIVSDLGGLHLYSWVYSAYLLARAVFLPVFGKLADLFKTRTLFINAIVLFTVASVMSGLSTNMPFLIVSRVLQGIGSGGIFALVYIVLADISSPQERGKTLSLASAVWGIASVLGPSLGGFVVTYFSWRWIFFINMPLGVLSLVGISLYLVEMREKKREIFLDYAGMITLSVTILGLLTALLLGGRSYAWDSLQIMALMALTAGAGICFYFAEKHAKDPIISLSFFRIKGFALGNCSVFLSSFAIFSLFAYAPVFIQGALGKSPLHAGMAMLSLSLGWSVGSLLLGYTVNRFGKKTSAVFGSLCLSAGCVLTLTFSTATTMTASFFAFQLVGLGMGFVTLATLLVVQNSLDISDLGVATTSHQFARTLGGTIGIGICGSFVTARLSGAMDILENTASELSSSVIPGSGRSIETLFRPDIQALLSPDVQKVLQEAVLTAVSPVFWIVVTVSILCFGTCLILPGAKKERRVI